MASYRVNTGVREPAHPQLVQMFDDLRSIYTLLRDTVQQRIDTAFDAASKKIGFVVTTTLPVVITVNKDGQPTFERMGTENLQGTIYEEAIAGALGELAKENCKASPGEYSIYLFWFDALKLKVKTDWLEPAHIQRGWLEPAHFLTEPAIFRSSVGKSPERSPVADPPPEPLLNLGAITSVQERILISAIDEIYPELMIASRLNPAAGQFAVTEGVSEPAHYLHRSASPRMAQQAVAYDVQEPAHFRWRPDLWHIDPYAARIPQRYAAPYAVAYDVQEPAHYQKLQPELTRRDYYAPATAQAAAVRPDVQEPAHYRHWLPRIPYLVRSDIPEPAHYRVPAGYELVQNPAPSASAYYYPELQYQQNQYWPRTQGFVPYEVQEPSHFQFTPGAVRRPY
ncbi:MAG: hypothetical protein JXR76_12570 [Deltaproteobacteria bacterium]|nr:hypothetical protein [Deltaproteobacteria bacterium]